LTKSLGKVDQIALATSDAARIGTHQEYFHRVRSAGPHARDISRGTEPS
jgi:hypothetical protein